MAMKFEDYEEKIMYLGGKKRIYGVLEKNPFVSKDKHSICSEKIYLC